MEDFSEATKKEECLFLPPGFRFHPTDEEIISEYLMKKALDHNFSAIAMAEVDLNKCEPWELPSKAKMGEKEWYFFSQKERRYPTGMRTNRATKSGYWKATGKDREIHKGKGILVGMKKTLVFYKGRAPKGQKTNWVMHEFRLDGDYSHHKASSKNDWAVARVFHKNEATKKNQVIEQLTVLHKEDAMARAPATANFTTTNASPSFIGQCSNSMMSTSIDTEVTNDWNNEISSYYDGSSFVSLCDFENMWN